jgi:transcriptional regulator with XRE-family HTH domain
MDLTKIVKTAMINNNIDTMKELADKADITYYKVSGFLNGDESIKLVDLKSMLNALDVEIKFISKGV